MNALGHLLRRVNIRNAQQHRLRTTLTIIGIAAGVALLASTTIINSTALQAIGDNEETIAGGASLEVASADLTGLPEATGDTIRAVDGVEAVAPLIRTTTRITSSDGAEARVLVLGVSAEFRDVFAGGEPAIEGGFGEDARGVVLSSTLADALSVEPGRSVRVLTPDGVRPVRVTGVLTDERAASINAGDIALMRMGATQFLFGRSGRVDSFSILAEEGADVADVRDRINSALGGAAAAGEPNARGRALETTFDALSALRGVTGAISLMVALFIVFMTMSMSIQERRRQLSTSLALGATRKQLLGAFVVEGLVVGTIGTALGIGGGVLLGSALAQQAIDALTFLPVVAGGTVDVGARSLALWAAAGIAISLAGAVIPARRILSVAPVEALRPEAHYEWEPERAGRGMRSAQVAAGGFAFVAGIGGMLLVGRYPDEPAIAIASVLLLIGGLTMLLPWIVPASLRLIRPFMIRLFGTTGRLAADGLVKNPARMALTVGALVLTAGTVVGVGAATTSYEKQFMVLADGWFGVPLYVGTSSNTGIRSDQPMRPAVRPIVEGIEGVRGAYPIRYNFSTIEDGLALVVATPIVEAAADGAGMIASFSDDDRAAISGMSRGGVIISNHTADRLGLTIGDRLTMPTPQGERSFPVAGLFEDLSTMYTVYVEQGDYARIWGDPLVDRFAVALEDGVAPGPVAERIDAALASAGVDAFTQTRADLMNTVLQIYRQLISLARGIQIAALIIAALAIANTMFTTVLERRWEFGLQRAIGMERKQIGRIVLLESGTIGLVGGTLAGVTGTSLGFVALQAENAAYSLVIPFTVPVTVIASVVVGGAVIAAAAGLYPRLLAVRPSIIETLRFD